MPNAISKAKRGVRRTAQALRRDRMRDYRQAADTVDALYDNLTRMLGRYDRRLDRASARTLERMRILQRRARGAARNIGRAEERAVERYGGLMAGAVGQEFALARATGEAMTRSAGAQVQAAKQQGRTVGELVDIAQAGAEEARAAADYELAQALAMRTKDDLALVAQQRHDIAMMKLQATLQEKAAEASQARTWELWKRQQDYLAKLAGPEMEGQALQVADRMAELLPYMHLFYTSENPDGTTEELMSFLTDRIGLQDSERQVVTMLAKTMSSYGILRGTSPAGYVTGIDAVMDVIDKLWPDLSKKTGKTLRETILAGIKFTWNNITREAETTEEAAASVRRSLTGAYGEQPSAANPYAGTVNAPWANWLPTSP